jgi:hypothetical protein
MDSVGVHAHMKTLTRAGVAEQKRSKTAVNASVYKNILFFKRQHQPLFFVPHTLQ